MREQESRWGEGCLTFTQTGMIKQVCRGRAIAKSRTRVSEISFGSEYCESPLSEIEVIQTLQGAS